MENYHEHIKMTKMRTASGKEKRGAIEVGIAISDVALNLFRYRLFSSGYCNVCKKYYSGKISHC